MIFNSSFLTFNFSKSEHEKGFTLIEMIIVITIIGVLAAFVVSNLATSQKRGYDTKRQGDVRTIQNSFEQYFAVNDRYPQDSAEAGVGFPGGSLPADPRGSGSYVYTVTYDTSAPVGENYCVCAELEVVDGGGNNNRANASDTSCNYTSPTKFFCASNLQ